MSDDRDLADAVNQWFLERARRLGDAESMVAALIMTVWAGALALFSSSVLLVLVLLTVALLVHALAVESASHAGLWVATGLLLFMIVLVLTFVLVDSPPVFFAFGGASALAYQQLVSVNTLRRRRARVEGRLVEANALAVVGCGVLALLAAALADAVNTTEERSWFWVPVTVLSLLVLGLALTLIPARWASAASRLRYQPGERMPPRPRAADPAALIPPPASVPPPPLPAAPPPPPIGPPQPKP